MQRTAFGVAVLLMLATTALAADTIKLGGMFPLSGRAEALGRECKLGEEMAVEEINAKGGVLGKKFELLSADDEAKPAKSVEIAKRNIQKDGVNEEGLPLLYLGDDNGDIASRGGQDRGSINRYFKGRYRLLPCAA